MDAGTVFSKEKRFPVWKSQTPGIPVLPTLEKPKKKRPRELTAEAWCPLKLTGLLLFMVITPVTTHQNAHLGKGHYFQAFNPT